ncbi:tRNA 2-thiouridine(34) synthase MnmA [Oligoflexia bacterium]|nr:tRNA 2-thiouridine(34) synthase MnmA [Oligoflexia bacterium]
MIKTPEKILVAMSGGVDSSVAAALLVEQGHTVVGAYMKNWMHETDVFGECPWQEDIDDARAVADKLGIDFNVVNLMGEYQERVVDYLVRGYQEGITPNPDVMCNREIKFGAFLDYALEQGFAAVATGHYTQNRLRADGVWELLEGSDGNKDQSYFLALLTQRQIAHARFPLGNIEKPEVRRIAQKLDLPNAAKKDSQGICFIGKVKMSDFLKEYIPENPGVIIDPAGAVLGEHQGLHNFTLGQRRGIKVASTVCHENYVVVEKRKDTNELVVAFDRPTTPKLYAKVCTVHNLTFPSGPITEVGALSARPRYRAERVSIKYEPLSASSARIEFVKPQRALAPGQICALHNGAVLVGGGIFSEIDYQC